MKYTFTIILSLILSLSTITSDAQTKLEKFDFGFAYGMSVNTVFNHVSGADYFELKISPYLFTAFAEYNYKPKLNFVAELEYANKGPKNYQINYLTLSFLPKYRISERYDISILGGIYTGYMFNYILYGQKYEAPNLKNYDLGIDTGFDFTFPIYENWEWFVSPRLEVGAIRFSFSNHISLQLKTGFRF